MSLDLVRHVFQLLSWKPLAASAALAAAASFVIGMGNEFDMAARFIVARASVLVIAVSLTFLIDDESSAITAASPTPLRLTRAHRLMVAAVPWAFAVGIVLILASRNLPTDPANPFPYIRLGSEALALALIATCVAAALGRRVAQSGRRATALLIMVATGLIAIPPPAQPWMTPFDSQYTGMGVPAWWLIAGFAAASFAALSWDAQTGR